MSHILTNIFLHVYKREFKLYKYKLVEIYYVERFDCDFDGKSNRRIENL